MIGFLLPVSSVTAVHHFLRFGGARREKEREKERLTAIPDAGERDEGLLFTSAPCHFLEGVPSHFFVLMQTQFVLARPALLPCVGARLCFIETYNLTYYFYILTYNPK